MNITHTSDKLAYAVVIGRKVVFMARPPKNGSKRYREPQPVGTEWFKTIAAAEKAKAQWERKKEQ